MVTSSLPGPRSRRGRIVAAVIIFVSAAALSPRALYVAAGIGHSLVAMAPNGDRAWSRSAGGTVTAVAWAPDGIRIAYVVQKAGRRAGALIVAIGTIEPRAGPDFKFACRPPSAAAWNFRSTI